MISLLSEMLIIMSFSERLTERRKQQGLTQEELGELVGLTKLQIYRYEKGASQPTLEVLKKLAINLNTSIDSLVFDEAERGPNDDWKYRFELIQTMSLEEQKAIKLVLDGMIYKHQAQINLIQLDKDLGD
ncbi:MAG: helix-turn-helix transcriptional regulator [Pseudomonadota bacterium]